MKKITAKMLQAYNTLFGDESDTGTEADVDMLLREVASENKATLLTQPGGIFATWGLEPDVISTHVRPMGLGKFLPPSIPSNNDDPRFPVFAGYGAETGSQPDYPCDDAPSGLMYAGTLTSQFGRIPKNTKTIEIDKLLHGGGRGVTTNLRLLGQIFGDTPLASNMTQEQILDLVVKAEMVGALVQTERTLAKMLWQGNPTNNTAHGGYKEFVGLDGQIITGHVDADGGGAMPNSDSYISNFGYNLVTSTSVDIVNELSFMMYYLENIADRTGVAPTQLAVVMRPELWHDLTLIYPSRYMSQSSVDASGSQLLVINDDTNVKMRDAMRAGMYIDVYGKRYPVITDDGIYEQTNVNDASVPAGTYASSIYAVPMKYAGMNQGVYMENIDYTNVNRQISPLGLGAQHLAFWTTNGNFLWNLEQKRFCFDMQVKCEPRVILRTPQLAGKIQNVRYVPKRHLRSPFPESPYWVGGGVGGDPATIQAALSGDYGRRFGFA